MHARSYRPPRRAPDGRLATRTKIMGAVRELLARGTFHAVTVEELAKHAGVSRATLYQHFGSRTELVDAVCDEFADNPALIAIRSSVSLESPREALTASVADAVSFWDSEESILRQLYGAAAVDPAAADLVARQLEDRRGEMRRLARNLSASQALRAGVTEKRALATLLLLTSFESFSELRRRAGMSLDGVRTALQEDATRLLLSPAESAAPR